MKAWRIINTLGRTPWFIAADTYEAALVEAMRMFPLDGDDVDVELYT